MPWLFSSPPLPPPLLIETEALAFIELLVELVVFCAAE
jgi:hypothetical protein